MSVTLARQILHCLLGDKNRLCKLTYRISLISSQYLFESFYRFFNLKSQVTFIPAFGCNGDSSKFNDVYAFTQTA